MDSFTWSIPLIGEKMDDIHALETKDENGEPAIVFAANRNLKDIVKQLIAANVNLNATSDHGFSALMEAAYYGYVYIVKDLLQSSINLECTSNTLNKTPLIYAVQHGHEEVVRELIQAGANINRKDDLGMSALNYAMILKKEPIKKYLLDQGADINHLFRGKTMYVTIHDSYIHDYINTHLHKLNPENVAKWKGYRLRMIYK